MKVLHGAYVEFGGFSWFSKKLIANLLGQNDILVFYKANENGGLGRSGTKTSDYHVSSLVLGALILPSHLLLF